MIAPIRPMGCTDASLPGVTLKTLAAITFLLLTAPVAAHLIGRAAYYSGIRLWHCTWIDELGEQRSPGDGSDGGRD